MAPFEWEQCAEDLRFHSREMDVTAVAANNFMEGTRSLSVVARGVAVKDAGGGPMRV